MVTDKPNLVVELALLAVLASLWGSSYLFIRVALESIPPLTLVACRATIALAVLIAVMTWRRLRFPRDARTWRKLLVQALLISIGAWTVLAWGQQFVDSGVAAVLNSTSPIFVILITLALRRRVPNGWRGPAGACLGLAGVVMIVGIDALDGIGRQIVAQAAILSGAVLYGGAALYGTRLAHLAPTTAAAGTMLWTCLALIPLSFALEDPLSIAPTPRSLVAAAALGFASTGIALLIYFRLVRTLGSLGVASQAYLRAGVGVLLGVVVLGESMTPVVGLGLATAVLGVALINAPAVPLVRRPRLPSPR